MPTPTVRSDRSFGKNPKSSTTGSVTLASILQAGSGSSTALTKNSSSSTQTRAKRPAPPSAWLSIQYLEGPAPSPSASPTPSPRGDATPHLANKQPTAPSYVHWKTIQKKRRKTL